MLKIASENYPEKNLNKFSCAASRKIGLSLFERNNFKDVPKIRYMFSRDKHEAQYFMK